MRQIVVIKGEVSLVFNRDIFVADQDINGEHLHSVDHD